VPANTHRIKMLGHQTPVRKLREAGRRLRLRTATPGPPERVSLSCPPPSLLLTRHRALDKSELLTALLKDLRLSLDGEPAKTVDHVLQQFEQDTPPIMSPTSSRFMEKRPKSSSAEYEHDIPPPDESHVSASVGSDEDLDFLEEDLLDDDGSSEAVYMGRNSQVQWMRTLQRKLNQPSDEPDKSSYAPPEDSEEATRARAEALHKRQKESGQKGPLSDYYFYLDKESLHEFEDVEPHAVPPAETAQKLFEAFQLAVHYPFQILDDEFKDQLHSYYRILQAGGTVNLDARWNAVLNLVFAIGARFSHLVGADWQAADHDHLVYMSRAVYFLGLKNIGLLVCAPDRLLIQVNNFTMPWTCL